MNIDSINNGIVIDHIKSGKGMDIYTFLELDRLDCSVILLKNVPSKRLGKKDVLKIDTLLDIDLNALGYIDHGITINVIKHEQIVEKYTPELPMQIANVIKCKNPRCITTTEQELPHVFKLTDKSGPVYRCLYCESKA